MLFLVFSVIGFIDSIILILKSVILVVLILVAVAFLTLSERKLLASLQRRKGPNVVGFFGLLQPLADGMKLMFKEIVFPSLADEVLFFIAPVLFLFFALASVAIIPFFEGCMLGDLEVSILYLFAISSFGVYGIILSGWSSNSRYAFLGALRSTAQMISYEISMGLILLNVLICVGSLNLSKIVAFQENIWLIFPLFPSAMLFFISILAETNRPPFDLPEAEAELVSGYNVEYSGIGFAMFFIGEYLSIIVMSMVAVLLFFGGWNVPEFLEINSIFPVILFVFKFIFVLFLFIWVRASFPRYRYDQLMGLGWKVLLPLSLSWTIFLSSYFFFF